MEQRFSNGKTHINCTTVGGIIDELNRLPRDLPAYQGGEDSVDLVVFNIGNPDMHLAFEDGGDWTCDEDS